MISGRTAQFIASAYIHKFSAVDLTNEPIETIDVDGLAEFLVSNDLDYEIVDYLTTRTQLFTAWEFKWFVYGLYSGRTLDILHENAFGTQRPTGQQILKQLAESILSCFNADFLPDVQSERRRDELARSLERNGYTMRNGILHAEEETVVDEVRESALLKRLASEALLEDINILAQHLDGSASGYIEGRWDDSISQSRKVFDWTLNRVARSLSHYNGKMITDKNLKVAKEVRDHLENIGLIDRTEKEVIYGIYRFLSENGSHPMIPNRDQARIARHLALSMSQFVILKRLRVEL